MKIEVLHVNQKWKNFYSLFVPGAGRLDVAG